jgi:hypothetical protein
VIIVIYYVSGIGGSARGIIVVYFNSMFATSNIRLHNQTQADRDPGRAEYNGHIALYLDDVF